MGQTIHYSSIWTEPITVNLQNMTRFFEVNYVNFNDVESESYITQQKKA